MPLTTQPRFGFALEYVPDIEAAKRFYVEVLGLEVEREAPVFVQFKDRAGGRFAVACDESMTSERGLELYWPVDDLEAASHEVSLKAEICMPLKTLPFGKVLGIKDPAGRSQFLIEFSSNRPSVER